MIKFFDSTLRDGTHAIQHQLKLESIEAYCKMVDDIGFHTIIVGHGNGLGASSFQVGLALNSDSDMLTVARNNLKKTQLGIFMIPGFGTIYDNLEPALKIGVDLVCIGTNCTEADLSQQHIEYSRNNGKEAYGILMNQHMTTADRLASEAKKMQDYGAMGVILMDSAGASIPYTVNENVKNLVNTLKIPVGFHPHNNLGLGVWNSVAAIQAGAQIVDGTIRGMGAGAGNCQLEVLAGLLQKMNIETGLNIYKMMDVSEDIVAKMMTLQQGIPSISLISGLTGVFSSYSTQVRKAAEQFNLDYRDIFVELGKRKVVGGQEDIIVDVAMNLMQKSKKDDLGYQLGSLL